MVPSYSHNWQFIHYLALSVPTFFHYSHHLQKIDCNSANFGQENTNYISNERYCPRPFASWVKFWNYFWKSGKICFWKSHFLRWGWKSTPPLVLKGLTRMSTLYQHFEYWKKCPPHYSTMVSVLFHHISMPEKCLPYYSTMVPALFQQSSALFPLIFSLKIVSA